MQHSVGEDFSHHSRYRTIDEMARAIGDAGGDVGAVITDPVLDRISVIPRGESEYFSLRLLVIGRARAIVTQTAGTCGGPDGR